MLSLLTLLVLGAVSQPTLENTIWTLISLSLGADTTKPGRAMTLPTLRIVVGKVAGSTGCNPLKASVRMRGQALLFRDTDAGKNDFCPEPALSLREDFITLLAQATRYSVQDGQLTIYAGRGKLTFSAHEAGNNSH